MPFGFDSAKAKMAQSTYCYENREEQNIVCHLLCIERIIYEMLIIDS